MLQNCKGRAFKTLLDDRRGASGVAGEGRRKEKEEGEEERGGGGGETSWGHIVFLKNARAQTSLEPKIDKRLQLQLTHIVFVETGWCPK